jgi:uncharacterized iron-regulated membrane protein
MKTRNFFRNLHLIAGLVAGLIASAVGVSGSILTFREEIERALYEPAVTRGGAVAPLQPAYERALAFEPQQRRVTVIVLPDSDDAPVEFVLGRRGARNLKESDQLSLYADPYTGEILGQRRRNDSFIAALRDLHFALFAGVTGLKINGWMALTLIFLSLTGLVLWFQTKSRGKAFTINWTASWKRVLWDLHRVGGAGVLAFLILVAATGAYYPFRETVQKALARTVGALPPRGTPPVAPPTPGAAPLGVDQVMARARATASNAQLAVLRPPASPTQAWTATFHRAGDDGESVDSGPTAYLDPYTGAALRVDDPARMNGAGRLLKWIEPIHFGKFGGLPTKLLWFLLGLAPAFLFGSGVVMWRNRTRGLRPVRAAMPARAEIQAPPRRAHL